MLLCYIKDILSYSLNKNKLKEFANRIGEVFATIKTPLPSELSSFKSKGMANYAFKTVL
jgi:hypothetical protein